MRVIDAHVHIPDSFTSTDMDTMFSLEFADEVWALSAPLTHWVGEQDNDAVVLKLSRDFPGKVIPFGYLHLAQGPGWVDRQCERGFAGLKAHTPPAPYDDDRFFPIYERSQSLEMPIVFHAGQAWIDTLDHYPHATGHRSRSTDWMHVERLDVVAKAFPGLQIIAAHGGWPHCDAAMALAMTHPNFYLDIAGYVGVLLESIARAVTVFGIADKLLLGSDIGLIPSAEETRRDRIREWQERVLFWKHYFLNAFPRTRLPSTGGADPSVADLVLHANALRILRRDEPSRSER